METIKIGDSPLSVRGHTSVGTVVSDRMKKTVVVEKDALQYISKYKRYARRKSRIPAHNPENIKAKTGDLVRIAECRKISKTVAWTVVEIIARKDDESGKKTKTQ